MVYGIILFGSLGGVTGPAIQGLVSRDVGPREQGSVQGSLTSLTSIAGILGPPIATGLFSRFISDHSSVQLPGAPYFFSAVLVVFALALALRSFRRNPLPKSPSALSA